MKKTLLFLMVFSILIGSFPIFAQDSFNQNSFKTQNGGAIVEKAQVQGQTNPIGVDTETPHFRWQMSDNSRGQLQTAYRIVLSSSQDKFENQIYDMWDSGKIISDKSNGILYQGNNLEASSKYYWQVFVWDKDNNMSSSSMQTFETGLMDSGWSGAKWITASDYPKDINIDTFTIEVDYILLSDAFSFLFGATDADNFYMWQISAYSWHSDIKFRPHQRKNGGFATIGAQPDITTVFPSKEDGINTESRLKIEVNKGNIKTYVNEILIDNRTVDVFDLGKIGFRSTVGSGNNEQSYADNVTIKDSGGNIIFSEDFSDIQNVKIQNAVIENGKIRLSNDGIILQNNEGVETVSASAPMFRKEFAVANKPIKTAYLYATSTGIYESFINGTRTDDHYFKPGSTQYNKTLLYQSFNVTHLLEQGSVNTIGAVIGHGWYNRANRNFGSDLTFHAKLLIKYEDGSSDVVVTDESWKYFWDGPILNDDFFMGYSYDANKEVSDWDSSGFNDSRWIAPEVRNPSTLISGNPVGKLVSQEIPPIRNTEILSPVSVNEPEPGVFIYDFGQNFAGIVRITATAPRGTVLQVRHAELLNMENMSGADGLPGTLYTKNLSVALNTDTYIFKGDLEGEIFEPSLVYHGFRYIEITGLDSALSLEQVEGLVLHTDLDRTGEFESSDSLINRLYENVVWSQRSNFMSVPTDCPQRNERWGWTGDAHIFARTASYLTDAENFFVKYMNDTRDTQHSSGGFTDVAPGGWVSGWGLKDGYATNGWGDAGVIIPWQIYQQYGNTSIIEENYDAMCAWIAYLLSTSDDSPNGYIRAKGWTGDWLPPDGIKTPFGVTDTAFCAYSAKLLSKMAAVIGKDDDSQYYENIFQNYKTAWNREYVNADGSTKSNTQTSYVLGLQFELFDENVRETAAGYLNNLIKNNGYRLTTGFLGVSYLNPILSDYGYTDTAFRLLEQTTYPSWLYSVTAGATTIWESWSALKVNPDGSSEVSTQSFNHYSYGAVMEWVFKDMLGIERDEENPAFKHILLTPSIGGTLNYAKGHYDSIYGRIESGWEIENNLLSYKTTIPANTTATLALPSLPEGFVYTEGGNPISESFGVTYIGEENGKQLFSLVSGSYEFSGTLFQRTITIENPQNINASVLIDGEEYSIPCIVPSKGNIANISFISNDPLYEFAYFTGDIYKAGDIQEISVSDNTVIYPSFRYISDLASPKTDKQLSINGPLGLSVKINGIRKSLPYSETFSYGTEIILETDILPQGKTFSHWQGIDNLSLPALFLMNEDIDLTAVLDSASTISVNYARGLQPYISNNQESPEYGWSRTKLTDGVTVGTGYTSLPIYNSPILETPIVIDFDLGSDKPIDEIILYPRSDSPAVNSQNYVFPQDFTISVKSEQDSTYIVIHNITNHADSINPVTFSLGDTVARNVRVTVTKLNAKPAPGDSIYRLQFAEIEIYGKETEDTILGVNLTSVKTELSVGENIIINYAIIGENDGQLFWYANNSATEGIGAFSDRVSIEVIDESSIKVKALKSGFVDIAVKKDPSSSSLSLLRLTVYGDNVNYLTYHAPDAIGSFPARKAFMSGETVTLEKVSTIYRDSLFFVGWGLSPDSKTPVSTVVTDTDTDVYALWQEKPQWLFDTHLGGFEPKSIDTTFKGIEDGKVYIKTSATDADFYLTIKNISLDADRYGYMRVKLKNLSSHAGDGLYYKNNVTDIGQHSQIPLRIDTDMDDFKTYEYDLKATPQGAAYWKGIVTSLRYDIIQQTNSEVILDYILFSENKGIFEVNITNIPAPETSKVPFTGTPQIEHNSNFDVSPVVWDAEGNVFEAQKVYTASVVLTAKQGYEFVFPEDLSVTIDGERAEVFVNEDNSITVTKSFPATLPIPILGILGDANGDGNVDALDVLTAMRFSVSLELLTELQQTLLDINGDGNVDGLDVLAMSRFAIGFEDEYGIGLAVLDN